METFKPREDSPLICTGKGAEVVKISDPQAQIFMTVLGDTVNTFAVLLVVFKYCELRIYILT